MAYEKKLIEGNFPCQQVGAETKRERGAMSMLPPIYYLHVWWARRPLTPSRAAVLGSILPADTEPELFLRELGIVKKQAVIGNARWTLVGKNLELIESDGQQEYIPFSAKFQKALDKENERRSSITALLNTLKEQDAVLGEDPLLERWCRENAPISITALSGLQQIPVVTVAADPAHTNERIAFASSDKVKDILGKEIKIDPEDLYGYGRAYETPIQADFQNITVLDPTAGGGSIPFEAARLGCNVIANDLNPVATAIEKATIQYPAQFGMDLLAELERYGERLVDTVAEKTAPYYYFAPPRGEERKNLLKQCGGSQELFRQFDVPEYDQQGLLYCRSVTCPSCGERAPLLNAFALQKKSDGWMVLPEIEGFPGHKKVRFFPVRLKNGKGPHGEDPERGTIKGGVGTCIHCGQAIASEEIKRQACGESEYGTWSDDLYCVVAVRQQPKLDKDGNVMRYTSGPNKGQVRTEKVTFFREPTAEDYAALDRAKQALEENWDRWEAMDLIPTENFPQGNDMRPSMYGMKRWCDMFTPRQLLGHLTAMETLHNMMPEILEKHGQKKGAAIITYLQFSIDKCLDYSSKQTCWHSGRGVIAHTFSKHDFSFKWTFGELVMSGVNSGIRWGIQNVGKSYKELCELLPKATKSNIHILNGSAANMDIPSDSVDVICVDPPYYNNVQYAELSDYFYVWQKRIFRDIYPDVFGRRLTNKTDEAVANPVRDGNAKEADRVYEQRMSEIFAECRRVMKDEGIMTMMFTHKTTEAWETLTKALIQNGWIISSSFPVDSEASTSMHQKDKAAAASSIFLACRKRDMSERAPAVWRGFGGTGVLQQLREAVRQSLTDYDALHLNAVDEMVASYGCALKVLSENWPVLDGDEPVTPTQAMREASTVVAQYQMTRLTKGRLSVEDLEPEAGIALTLFGIYGMGSFPFDDALSLSKSLNIRLENKAAGYRNEGRMIGINDERTGRRNRDDEVEGYYAPLVKRGGKLRLVLPEERNPRRLQNPQNEWDILQGLIMSFREGDMPVARAYLQRQAEGHEDKIIDILKVWADGCGSEPLSKEAQRILFGLRDRK